MSGARKAASSAPHRVARRDGPGPGRRPAARTARVRAFPNAQIRPSWRRIRSRRASQEQAGDQRRTGGQLPQRAQQDSRVPPSRVPDVDAVRHHLGVRNVRAEDPADLEQWIPVEQLQEQQVQQQPPHDRRNHIQGEAADRPDLPEHPEHHREDEDRRLAHLGAPAQEESAGDEECGDGAAPALRIPTRGQVTGDHGDEQRGTAERGGHEIGVAAREVDEHQRRGQGEDGTQDARPAVHVPRAEQVQHHRQRPGAQQRKHVVRGRRVAPQRANGTTAADIPSATDPRAARSRRGRRWHLGRSARGRSGRALSGSGKRPASPPRPARRAIATSERPGPPESPLPRDAEPPTMLAERADPPGGSARRPFRRGAGPSASEGSAIPLASRCAHWGGGTRGSRDGRRRPGGGHPRDPVRCRSDDAVRDPAARGWGPLGNDSILTVDPPPIPSTVRGPG